MSPKTTDRENFLLEVGVEELPASYIEPALKHIETMLREGLAESRLSTGEINTYSTPRRLAVFVHDLQLRQEDSEEEATGPAVKAAYDADGNPTKALQGFARGKGVDLSEIRKVQTDKGEYVAATVKHVGKPAAEVLQVLIERAIETTPFPKTMRWLQSAPTFRFARPIRWLVCLLGGEVVPVEVAGVTSGSQTRGHRFLSPDASPIGLAQSYLATLKQAHVIVDSAARRKMLVEGIEKLAKEAGGKLVDDEELIDINNNLVELPQAFMGRFDPSYLELPREVVVTAMREHQFYFAAEDSDGRLLPVFIAVRNGDTQNLDVVATGNTRVLKARLDDARFYWEVDTRHSPGKRVEELSGITWLEGMGTVLDKAKRVELLSAWLAARWAPKQEKAAKRAALLMKTDLLGEMIGSGKEYAKLEGVIGAYYAAHHGEPKEVVEAVRDHLKPKGASDTLPATDAGSVLAVADRIDTVTGCFLAGKIPTGSEDPFGVRRAGNGVIRILLEQDRHLDLRSATENILGLYGDKANSDSQGNGALSAEETRAKIREFWLGRVETALTEEDFAYDEIGAAMHADAGWTDPLDTRQRAAALREHRKDESFRVLVVGFKRVANILRAETDAPATAGDAPGGASWGNPAEKELASALARAKSDAEPHFEKHDYPAVLNVLLEMRGAIDSFFDNVMVNDPDDPAARLRRLGLLSEVRSLFVRGFDLSRIVVEG